MEAIGSGLVSIGNALGGIAAGITFFGITITVSATFLIYTNKMTLKDLKDFIKDLKR